MYIYISSKFEQFEARRRLSRESDYFVKFSAVRLHKSRLIE